MIEPTKIIEENDSEISIHWSDDKETKYNSVELRKACPCASCIDEWTGEKRLKDESVPNEINFTQITIVGRYALNFHFSDGHDTGILSFMFLRNLSDNN